MDDSGSNQVGVNVVSKTLQYKPATSETQAEPSALRLISSENPHNLMHRGSKVFRNSQISSLNPRSFSQIPKLSVYRSGKTHDISSISNQLDESLGLLDSQMKQIFAKQRANFLIAYRGVLQEINGDLNYYKTELEKLSQGRAEVENSRLRRMLKVFEDEVENMLAVTHKFETENRELRKKIVELSTDLKCEKELSLSVGKKNKMHKELAKLFYNENKKIIMAKVEDVNRVVADLEGNNGSEPSEPADLISNRHYVSKDKAETSRSFYDTQLQSTDNSPPRRAYNQPNYSLRVNTKGLDPSISQTSKTDRSHIQNEKSGISIQSESNQYQRLGFSEQSILRALNGILQNKLKPQFSLSETIQAIIQKAKTTQKIETTENKTNLIEDGLKNVSRSIFDDKDDFSHSQFLKLRRLLTKHIEKAISELILEVCSPSNHSSNSPVNFIPQQDLLDVFLTEKEINLAALSAINTIRSKNPLNAEFSSPIKNSMYSEPLRTTNEDYELLSEIKLTNVNIDSPQLLSALSNSSVSRFTERNSQIEDSTEEGGNDYSITKSKANRPHCTTKVQSYEQQRSNTERKSNSRLRSILKEKMKTNPNAVSFSNEVGYLNTGNGTFRSKSPLTKRVMIKNGKLLVGNNSLNSSPYKFDPNEASWS